MNSNDWSPLAKWGLACGIASLLLLPPILGTAGIIMGVKSKNNGDLHGETVWIVSAACMVVGMVLGAMMMMQG
jgi:hypothetical protein